MNRKRVLDFVVYVGVGTSLAALIVVMAIWNVSDQTGKGLISGLLSGIVVFTALVQNVSKGRAHWVFWATITMTAVVHVTLFATLGGTIPAIWLVLLVPLEYTALAMVLRKIPTRESKRGHSF